MILLAVSGSLPQSSILQEHCNFVLETSAKDGGSSCCGVKFLSLLALSLLCNAKPQSPWPDTSFYVCHRQKRSSVEDVATATIGKKVSPLRRRDARQIYNPPSGKYSASIGNFSYGEFGELGIILLVLWINHTKKGGWLALVHLM